jgi:putative SOS response-associated peptidase YedK
LHHSDPAGCNVLPPRRLPFYEWKPTEGGRQPYAIARQDGQPMAFAGLWAGFRWPSGEVTRTFTIVTIDASADVADLHNRMPLILEAGDWSMWLGEAAGNPKDLLRPSAEGTLQFWPVSRDVNAPHNNRPELRERLT